MKRSVRLTLKKETLAALTADDMQVVGGAPPHTLELDCFVVIGEHSLILLTDCCTVIETVLTCHRAVC